MCFDAFKEEYLVTYMFASSVPNFSGDVYSKEACVRECVSKYDTEYKQSTSKTEEKQQAIQHPNARPIKQKKKKTGGETVSVPNESRNHKK